MNTTTDIWFAFARTFAVLFVVLALLILVFYMIRKMSNASGIKGSQQYIKVLGMHHLSPKEKLALVDVLGEKIFIGITPGQISKLKVIEADPDLSIENKEEKANFSTYLAKKLGGSVLKKS